MQKTPKSKAITLTALCEKPLNEFNPALSIGQVNLSQLVRQLGAVQRNSAVAARCAEIATHINELILNQISTRKGRPASKSNHSARRGYVLELDNHNAYFVPTVAQAAKNMERPPQSVHNALSQKGRAGEWVYFVCTDQNGNPASHRLRKATEDEIASYWEAQS